jgi:hypothetical protein
MKPSFKSVTVAFTFLTATATHVAAQPVQPTEPDTDVPIPPPQIIILEPTPLTAVTPPPRETTYIEELDPQDSGSRTRLGIALMVGGGISGFTATTLRDTTKDGGNWTARATMGLFGPLSAELSYIGSAQSIDALGIGDNAILVGNGAQAALRLNLTGSQFIIPFVFGGFAWRHYTLTNTDTNTSDISGADNVYEVPAGAGLSTVARGVLVDLRAEWAYVGGADMVPNFTPGDDAAMHRWGVNLALGVAL